MIIAKKCEIENEALGILKIQETAVSKLILFKIFVLFKVSPHNYSNKTQKT